jgi:hypothetical protein
MAEVEKTKLENQGYKLINNRTDLLIYRNENYLNKNQHHWELNMITIKKIEGAFKTSYTLIDDATGLNVGLAKGKNWLIKRQAWNLCNNKDYLTNHKNTGHYNKITKCWFFDNDIENFMEEATED